MKPSGVAGSRRDQPVRLQGSSSNNNSGAGPPYGGLVHVIDKTFAEALNRSFSTAINRHELHFADDLALFCDILLRKGGQNGPSLSSAPLTPAGSSSSLDMMATPSLSHQQQLQGVSSSVAGCAKDSVESEFPRTIRLFRLLASKDVFEQTYQKLLAKRLLNNKVTSMEAEQTLLRLLREECGHQFTYRMDQMMKDVENTKDLSSQYRASLMQQMQQQQQQPNAVSTAAGPRLDLQVSVLTSGSWPCTVPLQCNIPPFVQDSLKSFEQFYLSKHQGRKLTWNFSMGIAEVIANFGQKRYVLTVSSLQMCMLDVFNSREEVSFEELLRVLGISPEELIRNMGPLLLVQSSRQVANLVEKSAAERTIRRDDVFRVNENFTSKNVRVAFPAMLMKDQQASLAGAASVGSGPAAGEGSSGGGASSAEDGKISEQRNHEIDCALVRIMKARKRLSHNDLIAEVTNQLRFRFTPQPSDIKKRIDVLIDREYLERDPADKTFFVYKA